MLGKKCSAYPNGRNPDWGYSSLTPPTFSEIQNFKIKINNDIDMIQQQVNAQEHTINHMQEGIETCFEVIEKMADHIGYKVDKKVNPFEFIAVDAKRRDDIRHIKNALYELYKWVLDNVQENKERSKGIECLEEAAMWLNKSISRRKDDGTQK